MRLSRLRQNLIVAGVVASAILVTMVPSVAANSRDIIRTGSCTGASDWKLKLSPEDGRIEVEWEIDSNRTGQVWTVVLKHNGTEVARTARKTVAPSGSFEYRRVEPNRRGTDRFNAYARNRTTGEYCAGAAAF
jgi:hypothetical protein